MQVRGGKNKFKKLIGAALIGVASMLPIACPNPTPIMSWEQEKEQQVRSVYPNFEKYGYELHKSGLIDDLKDLIDDEDEIKDIKKAFENQIREDNLNIFVYVNSGEITLKPEPEFTNLIIEIKNPKGTIFRWNQNYDGDDGINKIIDTPILILRGMKYPVYP